VDWRGAKTANGSIIPASSISKLPHVFGTTLDFDWTVDTRNASSPKTTPAAPSPRETWSEGCYTQVSIPVEALRSRRPKP
jgi:hypothetical protein